MDEVKYEPYSRLVDVIRHRYDTHILMAELDEWMEASAPYTSADLLDEVRRARRELASYANDLRTMTEEALRDVEEAERAAKKEETE